MHPRVSIYEAFLYMPLAGVEGTPFKFIVVEGTYGNVLNPWCFKKYNTTPTCGICVSAEQRTYSTESGSGITYDVFVQASSPPDPLNSLQSALASACDSVTSVVLTTKEEEEAAGCTEAVSRLYLLQSSLTAMKVFASSVDPLR